MREVAVPAQHGDTKMSLILADGEFLILLQEIAIAQYPGTLESSSALEVYARVFSARQVSRAQKLLSTPVRDSHNNH